MASRTLQVNITGDPDSFSRAMRRVSQDTDSASKRLKFFSDSADSSASAVSGVSLRVGAFGGSIGRLAPALAAATPALVALGGAATAVAGSFTAAAAGAGALGTGLAASLAPVLVVGKQVTSRFEEIKKAYEAVKTAQKEGTEAAQKNAAQALAELSKNERAAVDSFTRIAGLQERVLGGASDRIIGAISGAIDRIAPALLTLEKPFDRLGGAIGRMIDRASRSLSGPAWRGAMRAFVDSATALIGPFSKAFGAVASIIRDVALAALPLVRSGFRGVAQAFADLDKTATRGAIRKVVRELVGHTRSWWNLTKEVGELLFRVFNGGAKDGQSLVDTLTKIVNRWNRFLGTREGQREMRRFFSDAVEVTKDLVQILAALVAGAFKVSNAVMRVVNGLQDFERWVGKADAALNKWVSGALRDVRTALAQLPSHVRRLGPLILTAAKNLGRELAKGVAQGIKSTVTGKGGGVIADALRLATPGGLGSVIGKAVGDGIGRNLGPSLSVAGLDGADPDLAPFAAVGGRFGLRVSSGLRPGAITSTGNPSFHGTGDAIDMSGPAGGMLATFRTLKKTFGPKLRELIYTPGGAGIKDGRPFTYTGQVAADHHDHVHVAYTGPFGDGIGDAARAASRYWKGDDLVTAVAVAGPESTYRDAARLVTSQEDSRGMWQVNTLAHPWAASMNLRDTNAAAGAAFRVWSQAGRSWSPWTGFTSGNYRNFLSRARAAVAALGRAGGAPGASGGGGGTANIGAGARGAFQGAQKEARGQAREAVGSAREEAREERAAARELPAARLGVRRAKAEARDDLSALIKVMVAERAAKRRRLKAIRKVLKRRINKKRRVRLLNEEAELIAEIGDLTDSIKEYKADQAGGATTITRAEELEAGVDPGAQEGETGAGGGGDTGGAAAAEPDPNIALLAEYTKQLLDEQRATRALVQAQGPALLAAFSAWVSGDIGGKVGLGYSTPGYAGAVASY